MVTLTHDDLINLRNGLNTRRALSLIREEVMLINDDCSNDAFLVLGEQVLRVPHAALLQRIERMLVGAS